MTLRICILGNSHMAAFSHAVTQNPDRWQGVAFDFFGAQAGLDCYHVVEGKFVTQDEDVRARLRHLMGRDHFDVADYDGYIIASLGFSIFPVIFACRQARCLATPGISSFFDASGKGRPFISHALLKHLVAERLQTRQGYKLAAHLVEITGKQTFLASQPRPIFHSIHGKNGGKGLKHLFKDGAGGFASDLFETTAKTICQEAGVTYIAQPEQSIDRDLFTHDAFMRGSVTLARNQKQHAVDDVLHANAEFAALMLDNIAAQLDFT